MNPADNQLGELVAKFRRLRGLSQRELGDKLQRSESWVSQVERGVHRIERLSMLQALADALDVPLRDIRPDANNLTDRAPSALDDLRLALTGHPALGELLEDQEPNAETLSLSDLDNDVDRAWTLAHASEFDQLNRLLSDLLPKLEVAARRTKATKLRRIQLARARAYQAAAAAFARQDEADAAWIASDRAIAAAELSGEPLQVIAGLFRMAHAFLLLSQFGQAEHAAQSAIEVLQPAAEAPKASQELLSIYGAMHLVRAVIAAREGNRTTAHQQIEQARTLAQRLNEDRNDFDTEFGPTNVELHAMSIAVDLGDAGEAVDIAAEIDPSPLSPERQFRFHLDLARAHAQRRHAGEATAALLEAEHVAPEQAHSHHVMRTAVRDVLQLAGRSAPAELRALGDRIAATP